MGVPGFRRQPVRDIEDGAGEQSDIDEAAPPPFDPFAVNPDQRYEVKAEELLRPFLEPGSGGLLRWWKQTTNAPIAQVEDAYITGKLDLRGADLQYLFLFERCRFEQPPDVREASLLGLIFRQCWLPGLQARNFRSRNDVRLMDSVVEAGLSPADSEIIGPAAEDTDRDFSEAAVNLTDAVVDGSVVLTRSHLLHPQGRAFRADRILLTGALLAQRLQASGEVRFPGLRVGGNVDFSGALLENPEGVALLATGLQIGGNLMCGVDSSDTEQRSFTARGVLDLTHGKVSGDVVFRQGKLVAGQTSATLVNTWQADDPYADLCPALLADRMHVEGNVELSDDLDVTGTIRMINAHIGGSLRLAGARISVTGGRSRPQHDRAIHLDGSHISGDLDGNGLRTQGQFRLADVTVGGNAFAEDGIFTYPADDAFSARRSHISGNLTLSDCSLNGTLRLQGITVGGSVELRGTQLAQPGRTSGEWTVDLRSAQIARSLELTANGSRAFSVYGGVSLDGAVVKRRIDLTGAVLRPLSPRHAALDAGGVVVDEFALTPAVPPDGKVVLAGARCDTLSDTRALWEAIGGVELEDFRYESLDTPIDLRDNATVKERIRLLRHAMRRYRPGPYDQFAAMLRAGGNEEHADMVMIKKQQYRYESLARGSRLFGVGVRLWSWLQRSMVGYGYRPLRALTWLAMLLVTGSLWFGLGDDDCVNDTERFEVIDGRCVVNQDDTGLEWNPVLYTADLLVPITDFGNKGRWHMGGVDKWVATGFIGMGWVLVTTVAAGVTRTLRRNEN